MASKVVTCRIERTGIKRKPDVAGRYNIPKVVRDKLRLPNDIAYECCIIQTGGQRFIGFLPDIDTEQELRRKICAFLRTYETTMDGKVIACVFNGTKIDGPSATNMAAKLYAGGKDKQLVTSTSQALACVYQAAMEGKKGQLPNIGTNQEFLYSYKVNDESVLLVLSPEKDDFAVSESILKLTAEAIGSIISCYTSNDDGQT